MHKNDRYLINNNLKPRGIEKWSPFSALDGYYQNIKSKEIIREFDEKVLMDEQLEVEINNEMISFDHKCEYYIKYFDDNINKVCEYTGKIKLNQEEIEFNNVKINTNKLVRFYKVGKNV